MYTEEQAVRKEGQDRLKEEVGLSMYSYQNMTQSLGNSIFKHGDRKIHQLKE